MRFWQDKEWVDDKGRAIREEVEHGTVGSDEFRGKWLVTYEYSPKGVKIEAPPVTPVKAKQPG